MTIRPKRRGLSAVEVIIAVIVVGIVMLYAMLAIPRSRETARKTGCQKNLMQIGMALSLYTQGNGPLPPVRYGEDSPLAEMLNELKQPDFLGLRDRKVAPRLAGKAPTAGPVRGFACPSDPGANDGSHPAPISYRAATGDTFDGLHGAFEPGQRIRMSEIEQGKGIGFVAAFSERLVGSDRPEPLADYSLVPGPIGTDACPAANPAARKSDAGSSWLLSNWTNTLYHHAIRPNVEPSCVADDGKSAGMGATSAHAEGVHVLTLDGAAKIYRPSVDATIWRGLANTRMPDR